MLTQSAPVYYPPHHQMTSMSLPNNGFAMPPRGFAMAQGAFRPLMAVEPHQHQQQAMEDPHASYAQFGGHQPTMLYPVPMEEEVSYHHHHRVHAPSASNGRRGSAPAVPMMMMVAPGHANGGFHWQAAQPMLSASYGDYCAPGGYGADNGNAGFPMMPERKHVSPGSSPGMSRANARRSRPAGVPALSFTGLGQHHHAHSPASASASIGSHLHSLALGSPMVVMSSTPHSARSMSSVVSDYEAQYSPMSTPRSASSTPRSSTSTPRSGVGSVNEKKRARTGVPHPLERERRVRPKVVAEKGALQCKGINRKKNTRCRNAALMEYIGPRPLYCAEHITLDPESYYSKCASTFHKVHGDGKGCREVVLKELQFCHKHYNQALDVMLDGTEAGFMKSRSQLERISALQTQLESEAAAAKRVDPDLFQRKHKLIPKFQEMRKLLQKRMQEFETSFGHLIPAPLEFRKYKYEEQTDSKDSASLSSMSSASPSGSEDGSVVGHFEDPSSVLMHVEPQSYPVY